jgi:hypothetical protein
VTWLVAHAFPRPTFLIEADKDGGRFALRHGLAASEEVGLVRLAALNRALSAEFLVECSQQVGSVNVVCAPPRGQVVRASLAQLENRWVSVPDSVDLLVDAGRLSSASAGLLRQSQCVVLVVRPLAEDVAVAAGVLSELRSAGCFVKLLLAGGGPYSSVEISEYLDANVVGHLEWSDASLAKLMNGNARGWRTTLGQTVHRLAGSLATEFADRPLVMSESLS